MHSAIRRILIAAVILLSIVALGGIGYWILSDGLWPLAEGVYFAIITVSTVGFAELPEMEHVHGARLLTAILILVGSAALVFFQSNITAALVEGTLGQAFRRRRMRNQILAIKDHIVVAGLGSTGKYVVEELWAIQRPFVAIDRNLEHIERINEEVCGGKMLYVHGDATEDHVLTEAGIQRAAGVVAALTSDRENLFVTLSARNFNASARIVAKVVEAEADKKMRIAGASATVSPNIIGGQRMASELVRPDVLVFLDQMMRDKDKNLRLEELTIPVDSSYVGMALRDVPFRTKANVLVVAVRDEQGTFIYNPGSDYRLRAGTVLIMLGETHDVKQLHELMRSSSSPS
jgi:voltage-gated potassium channel